MDGEDLKLTFTADKDQRDAERRLAALREEFPELSDELPKPTPGAAPPPPPSTEGKAKKGSSLGDTAYNAAAKVGDLGVRAVKDVTWGVGAEGVGAVATGARDAVQNMSDAIAAMNDSAASDAEVAALKDNGDPAAWAASAAAGATGYGPLLDVESDGKTKRDGKGVQLPRLDFARPDTVTGKFIQQFAQFQTGLALLKPLPVIGNVLQKAEGMGLAGEAIKDFTVTAAAFDPHEKRLSNMLKEVAPSALQSYLDFVAADDKDGQLEGRLKNALENAAIGAVAGRILAFAKAVRAKNRAKFLLDEEKRLSEQAAREALAAGVQKEAEDAMTAAMRPLGDIDSEELFVPLPEMTDAGKTAKLAAEMDDVARGPLGQASPHDLFVKDKPDLKGKLMPNINLAVDDQTLERMALRAIELDKEAVSSAQRGVVTQRQTELSAGMQNVWKEMLEARVQNGGVPLAGKTKALRNFFATSCAALRDTALAAVHNPSPETLLAHERAKFIHGVIQRHVMAIKTEYGRGLNQFNMPAKQTPKLREQLDAFIQSRGGDKRLLKMAEDVAMLAKTDNYAAMSKYAALSTLDKLGQLHGQYLYFSLLSGPKTIAANAGSGFSKLVDIVVTRAAAVGYGQLSGSEAVALEEVGHLIGGMASGFRRAWSNFMKNGAFLDGDVAKRVGASQLDDGAKGAMSSEQWAEEGKWLVKNLRPDPMHGGIKRNIFGFLQSLPYGRAMDFLDTVLETPGRIIRSTDDMFKAVINDMELPALAYRRAREMASQGYIRRSMGESDDVFADRISQMAAELRDNPTPEMLNEAAELAVKHTYADAPMELMDKALQIVQKVPVLGRLTVPFRKSGLNIFRDGLEHSPFAPVSKRWWKEIEAGGARADIAKAQWALGTMFFMTVVDWTLNGVIHGSGPDDPEEKEAERRSGRIPHSIQIGATRVGISRLDPIASPFVWAADFAEAAMNQEDDDDLGDKLSSEVLMTGILGIGKTLMNRTQLMGVGRVVEAITNGGKNGRGERLLEGWMGMHVPVLFSDVAQAIDPDMKVAQSGLDAMRARLPMFNSALVSRHDVWGRKVSYKSALGKIGRMVSPIEVREENEEPIDAALRQVRYAPQNPSKTVHLMYEDDINPPKRGVPVNLSRRADIYEAYKVLAGNGVKLEMDDMDQPVGCKDYLNAVVQGQAGEASEEWKTLTDGRDGGKALFVRSVMKKYRDAAMEELKAKFPELREVYNRKKSKYIADE